MDRLIFVFATLILIGCSDESGFSQYQCEYMYDNTLVVNFSDNKHSRYISIDNNTFTFKGTTLSDAKWRVELSAIKSIEFTDKSELQVTLLSEFSKVIGKVDDRCKSMIKSKIDKLQNKKQVTANKVINKDTKS